MELYQGQLINYPFHTERRRNWRKKADGDPAYLWYCLDIMTLDIEASSGWIEGGEVIGYRPGMPDDYWNGLEPVALPYIWQFSINDRVFYGRDFRGFKKLLEDLPQALHAVIFVHNLSYEFAFLIDFLTCDQVFARSPHKPMKCSFKEAPNVEFRCSYVLTRLPLESWGKQIGLPKMVGDLDYERIRTPDTDLTAEELGYCERDCLVVYAGIKDYVRRYGSVWDIPLTQTGTVRREVKGRLMSNPEYCRQIKKLVPRDHVEYGMLQDVFAGGYTHANRWYAGELLRGHIEHYDFASSYPFCMIAHKYPATPWVYTGEHEIPPESRFEDWAYIMRVRFTGIDSTNFNTYLQGSKAASSGAMLDNGRIMRADAVEIWITEQDYITIRNNYTWEDLEVLELYESRKKYLPKELTAYLLELYRQKTELKGVDGMEDIYAQAKQYINSVFGMAVTGIVQSDVVFDGTHWSMTPLTAADVDEKLQKLASFRKGEKRYFLSYSWGCWVTAYARRRLWRCIEQDPDAVIYGDTDSLFLMGAHDFSEYNASVTADLRKACREQGLDFQATRPKTPKGVEKPLGIFAREDDCTEFRTLGAKRYCERRADGELYLTISGINKGAVAMLGNDLRNFRDGFNFDKDDPSVHKLLSTYLTEMEPVTWPDGYRSDWRCGINMRRTGYKLSMTDDYKELIHYAEMTVDGLPDDFFIRMRGVYT